MSSVRNISNTTTLNTGVMKKILIIDDDKLIAITLKRLLTREGYNVFTALSGVRAFGLIQRYDFDLIMSDIKMPAMDGIETVKAIVNHLKKINKNTPIIVLTGIEDYSIGRAAWELGIKDYLIKNEIHSQDLSRALTFATHNDDNIVKKSMLS